MLLTDMGGFQPERLAQLGMGLVFREEVIDDDFGEPGVRHVLTSAFLQLPAVNLECKVFPNQLRKLDFSMVDACGPHTCWDACVGDLYVKDLLKYFNIDHALLVRQKKLIRFYVFDLLNSVPELLHENFRDFSRDSECLVAGRVLDDINDNLKRLFLLWHSIL
ncbi:hypothetical protein Tco_0922870 [Tanacetum coccineum]|uniref:Uncharacterized protein n=1 Tax=Tanacetum coccineum TaxID=301880 RepID=A0ABQ5CZD0_9ASTR